MSDKTNQELEQELTIALAACNSLKEKNDILEGRKRKLKRTVRVLAACLLIALIPVIKYLIDLRYDAYINKRTFDYERRIILTQNPQPGERTAEGFKEEINNYRAAHKDSTYMFSYNTKSIKLYHRKTFSKIVNSIYIDWGDEKYENCNWEMAYYLFTDEQDKKVKLAMIPSLVKKDDKNNIIEAYDFFDPKVKEKMYPNIQLEDLRPYDFGHLKP